MAHINAVRRFYGILFLCVAAGVAVAQDPVAFRAVSVDGTARVQRSQKRAWEKVEIGDRMFDNDLVETYFQTKLIMQFGVNNIVILGSNSKALLNITEKAEGERTITEINLTLFNGGIFSKAISDCKINIYTAHAVGTMDSGSVTTVAEGKTGETGFQVLGGSIYVRNIAQQKGIELRPGLTTMIQPGKEPTAPLYITHRHVSVLQHYFGNEYIVAELDASGIKPTDERATQGGGYNAFAVKGKEYVDEGMYKSLFSLNRIYGSILDDREKNSRFYAPVDDHPSERERPLTVVLRNGIGITAGGVSPRICPGVTFRKGLFDMGVRFSFVGTVESGFTAGFTSLNGILDKIDHLSIGNIGDPWSVFLGPLNDVTFGYGLVVNHFTNQSRNNAFHPLGFHGHVRIIDALSVQAFTSAVSAPWVTGMYVLFEPLTYHVGVGYAADFNQFLNPVAGGEERFAAVPQSDSLYPSPSRVLSPVHCYMADLSADIIDLYNFRFAVAVEFAQKLFGGMDGFTARMPSFHFDLEKTSFGGGVVVESGKMLSGQFDGMYMENRFRVKSDLRNDFIDSLFTPNNRLSADRNTFGFSVFYKMNPLRGTDIDFFYKQDFLDRKALDVYSADTLITLDHHGDFSYRLKIAVNDSLVKIIRYAQLVLQQSHGRLFPPEGLPFRSWTFDGSLDCIFTPFFFGISFEVGGSFFYIDAGKAHDNLIKSGDIVFEGRLGLSKNF